METIHEWSQCFVKSIIALHLWEMNILRARGNGGNIKIICDRNDEDFLRRAVLLFSMERFDVISYTFSQGERNDIDAWFLMSKRCTPDSGYISSLRDTWLSEIRKSKHQSCRIERGWPEGSSPNRMKSCTSSCKDIQRQKSYLQYDILIITLNLWL